MRAVRSRTDHFDEGSTAYVEGIEQ